MHYTKNYFYRYYQTGHTTNPQYLETLKKSVSAIDSYGGAIWTEVGLSKAELMATAKIHYFPNKKRRNREQKNPQRKNIWELRCCEELTGGYRNLMYELQKDFTKDNNN